VERRLSRRTEAGAEADDHVGSLMPGGRQGLAIFGQQPWSETRKEAELDFDGASAAPFVAP